MPRISVNESTTYHWSLLEDVTGFQAAGIPGIGVWRRKLADFGEERGVELLRESKLEVTCFSSAGGFTGSDGQTFREAVDDALEALRLAAEMRAGCLVVVSGAKAGHTFNHARRLVREALVELGDAAAAHNLQIAVQFMHRLPVERWSFINTLDAAVELLAGCRHARVGMVFDLFHFWREPELCRRIPQIVPWIKLAALTDARLPAQTDDDRCLPGQGDLPLAEIITALENGGYRGAYDVQLISERCRESDYESLLADCRKSLGQLVPALLPTAESPPRPHPVSEIVLAPAPPQR
ncbi:MAG: sugar phosphate isomerase/epimerase [Planctomycetia bacterium]|nr:sugar phosphate isomerase/epimerase [Planctomycetia bacterium]